MKKLEYKISVSFKRFLGLLVEYIKSSKRLVFIYLTVLLLDSFTKMFSVVAIIPLIFQLLQLYLLSIFYLTVTLLIFKK